MFQDQITEDIFLTLNSAVIDFIQMKCLQQWYSICVFIGKSTIPPAVVVPGASMSLDLLKFSRFFPSFFFPSTVVSCLPELRFPHFAPSASCLQMLSINHIQIWQPVLRDSFIWTLSCEHLYVRIKKKFMGRVHMSNSCSRACAFYVKVIRICIDIFVRCVFFISYYNIYFFFIHIYSMTAADIRKHTFVKL